MPETIYKKIFKDPDCSKLTKNQSEDIYTYTAEKIPVIGSCELLVLLTDNKCFLNVPFHVVSVEGSVIVSCVTSINLNLIQIHNKLNTNIPDCARLYYSSADKPRANQEHQRKVDHTVMSDKNCQDPNLRKQIPARKHMQAVTCSRKNNPGIPNRNQDDDKNCQYNGVKGIKYTDSKHQMTKKKQYFMTRTVKKPICRQCIPYHKHTADCGRIKHVNQQDIARRSLTHTKGRRYRMTSYQNKADTSQDATSTT